MALVGKFLDEMGFPLPVLVKVCDGILFLGTP